jgi:excisionase family DNA binding protein
MGISNLKTHSASYVTVAELAEYWEVTRQLVYKHIQTGLLPAMRLGPRCFRVRTTDAIDFEQQLSSKSSGAPRPNSGVRASAFQLIRPRDRDPTTS